MQSSRWRLIRWLVVGLVIALAWRAGARFPWGDTWSTLRHADPGLLAWAALISLLTLGAKGWAWHLLLRPVARHRWWIAQEANLVGSAVNYISVAVIGEAARVRLLATRDAVPIPAAVASVVWTRATEGIGLALFILVGALALQLPPLARGAEIGAVAVLAALFVMMSFRRWDQFPA